jgi:hypothetical protein
MDGMAMVEECIIVGLSVVACLEMVEEWAVALSNFMIQIDVWRAIIMTMSNQHYSVAYGINYKIDVVAPPLHFL